MQATVIKTAAALIFTLIPWAIAGGVSPLLNSPRAGDRLDVAVLAGAPAFSDSLRLCPDLSDISVRSAEPFTVWSGAPDDTINALCISQGRKTIDLSLADGIYLLHREQTPGFSRQYHTSLPYGVTNDAGRSDTLLATGRAESVASYRAAGHYRINTTAGLKITTPDGLTVDNVECVVCETDDRMFFDGDTSVCIHRGIDKAWYAPGYRYPVLKQHFDLLLSEEGDTIDRHMRWETVAMSQQEEAILDDPVNEEIRRIVRERNELRYSSDNSNNKGKETDPKKLHPSVTVDYAAKTAKINRTPGDSRFIDMMLCDIGGRVYQTHVFSDNDQSATLSLVGLAPSTYLIYIRTDDEPIVCKFNL